MGFRRMSDKPLDPALAEALLRIKHELRSDLSEALKRGAATWAAQSNQVFESVNARLARLEQRTSNKKGR
jgi:hypothetical protein